MAARRRRECEGGEGQGKRTGSYVGGAAAGRKRQAGQARGDRTHTLTRTSAHTARDREREGEVEGVRKRKRKRVRDASSSVRLSQLINNLKIHCLHMVPRLTWLLVLPLGMSMSEERQR